MVQQRPSRLSSVHSGQYFLYVNRQLAFLLFEAQNSAGRPDENMAPEAGKWVKRLTDNCSGRREWSGVSNSLCINQDTTLRQSPSSIDSRDAAVLLTITFIKSRETQIEIVQICSNSVLTFCDKLTANLGPTKNIFTGQPEQPLQQPRKMCMGSWTGGRDYKPRLLR